MPRIHTEQSETWAPALPRRTTPSYRTEEEVSRLWQASGCYDLGVLERVSRSLRELDTGSEYQTRT